MFLQIRLRMSRQRFGTDNETKKEENEEYKKKQMVSLPSPSLMSSSFSSSSSPTDSTYSTLSTRIDMARRVMDSTKVLERVLHYMRTTGKASRWVSKFLLQNGDIDVSDVIRYVNTSSSTDSIVPNTTTTTTKISTSVWTTLIFPFLEFEELLTNVARVNRHLLAVVQAAHMVY